MAEAPPPAVILLAALSAGPAYAACTYPKAPDKVPDGNTATLQDMLESQKAVKQFDAEVTSYQGCLEAEHKAALAADATLTEEQKAERAKIVAQKHNAAADDAQAAADKLNAQIRVYKEKNKK